ncbi:MAG: VWA domain-containing protein [Acidimicrobiales bacterium]
MTFLSPGRLWLLVLAAALLGAYLVLALRRQRYAVRFTNLDLLDSVAPERPNWRRHLPAAAFLVGIVAATLAWARPAQEERVPKERATVMMAIDTSLSMMAQDVDPNRIDAAKAAAAAFVDLLPAKINLGLVSFNGAATIRVPPTTEHEKVKAAIDGLALGEATAIGEAIFASLDAIESVPADEAGTPPPARIVLMSDGETTVGRPDSAAVTRAAEASVPVSTIAFGTASGTVTLPNSRTPVPVPVNKDALRRIADDTGGTFFEAASAEELAQVYADIGSSVGYEVEHREVGDRFVLGALAALFAAGVMSLAWFSRLP